MQMYCKRHTICLERLIHEVDTDDGTSRTASAYESAGSKGMHKIGIPFHAVRQMMSNVHITSSAIIDGNSFPENHDIV